MQRIRHDKEARFRPTILQRKAQKLEYQPFQAHLTGQRERDAVQLGKDLVFAFVALALLIALAQGF